MAKVNKVEVEIVATDEASPKIDRLEKKIDGLESDEARIVVTADITRLEKALSGSKRLMEEMEGDELTVQARVTGRIEEDLEAARRLFNELDGKTGTVTITANTAQLEEAARRAADRVDDIGRSANSSKSVLANAVGNSTQDVAALGGVAGTAGVALGQMGEYMADAVGEGEKLGSVLKSFGTIAIPVAAVTGLVAAFQNARKSRAWLDDRDADAVDRYAKALDDAESSVEAITNALIEARRIDLDIALPGFTKAVDLTPKLRDLGLTVEDFARLVAGGEPTLERFSDEMERAGFTADEYAIVIGAARQESERFDDAQRGAAAAAEVFSRATEQSGDAAGIIADEIQRAKDNVDRFGPDGVEQMGAVEDATDDTARSVSSLRDEWQLLMGVLDKREAIRNAKEALEELPKAAAAAWTAADEDADDAQDKFRDYEAAIDDVIRKLIAAGTDPITINTVLETIDQGKINEAVAIGQAKLDATPPLRVPVALDVRNTNLRFDEFGNVQSRYTPPRPTLNFGPAPGTSNVTIINPPGTPAATAGSLDIFLSRNGER